MPQQAGGADCAQDDCNGDGALNVADFADDPRVAVDGRARRGGHRARRERPDRRLLGRRRHRRQRLRGRHRRLGLLRRRQRPLRRVELLEREQPRHRPRERRRRADERGRGRRRRLPRVPGRAAACLGHLRGRHEQLRAGGHLRGRQRRGGRGGRCGRAAELAFAKGAFDYAYRKGDVHGDRLLGPQHARTTTSRRSTTSRSRCRARWRTCRASARTPVQRWATSSEQLGIATTAPIGTWFRNSGTTQYGGHAHIVMPAVTGSTATGQASGAAGLIASYGPQRAGVVAGAERDQAADHPHRGGRDCGEHARHRRARPRPGGLGPALRLRQAGPGLGARADRAGEDPAAGLHHRPGLVRAAERGAPGQGRRDAPACRPSASPEPSSTSCSGRPASSRSRGTSRTPGRRSCPPMRWTGRSARSTSRRCATRSTPGPVAAPRWTRPRRARARGTRTPTSRRSPCASRSRTRRATWARTERCCSPIATPPCTRAGRGGWGTGARPRTRMFDLDGDNRLDVIEADSSGELRVLGADGSPLASFNGGQPVRTRSYPNVHSGAAVYGELAPPREVLRTPAIGDIDGDREPEIVDTAGEHIYAWHTDGSEVDGFPVRIDPSKSEPRRPHEGQPHQARLHRLAVARRPDRRRRARDRRAVARPARLRVRRLRRPAAGLPLQAARAGKHARGRREHQRRGDRRHHRGRPARRSWSRPTRSRTPSARPARLADPRRHRGGVPRPCDQPSLPGARRQRPGLRARGERPTAPRVAAQAERGAAGRAAVRGAGRGPRAREPRRRRQARGGRHGVDRGSLREERRRQRRDHLRLGCHRLGAGDGGQEPRAGPVREPDRGGPRRRRRARGDEGRDHAQPAGEHRRGCGAEPAVQPRDAGVERRHGGIPAGVPAGDGGLPAALAPGVADVSDAPGREVLAGTGLYYLRNINANGVEGTGWPKFTGGWIFASPAVGDVDGDGKLEVSVLTREGWSFLWDTDSPACGTNEEWWTARHDERGTGTHGTDSRPPGTPRDLAVSPAAAERRSSRGRRPVTTGCAARPSATRCGRRAVRSTPRTTARRSEQASTPKGRGRARPATSACPPAPPTWRCSTATTPGTGATWPRPRWGRPAPAARGAAPASRARLGQAAEVLARRTVRKAKPCAGLKGRRLSKCKLDREVRRTCGKARTSRKRKLCGRRVRALTKCRSVEGREPPGEAAEGRLRAQGPGDRQAEAQEARAALGSERAFPRPGRARGSRTARRTGPSGGARPDRGAAAARAPVQPPRAARPPAARRRPTRGRSRARRRRGRPAPPRCPRARAATSSRDDLAVARRGVSRLTASTSSG